MGFFYIHALTHKPTHKRETSPLSFYLPKVFSVLAQVSMAWRQPHMQEWTLIHAKEKNTSHTRERGLLVHIREMA